MRILVGSLNPGKIEGVKKAFEMYFTDIDIRGVDAKSLVPDQPVNAETMTGAFNRVQGLKDYAKKSKLDVDYFVAVESGLVDIFDYPVIINACYMENSLGKDSYGFSRAFPVPKGSFNAIKEKGFTVFYDELLGVKHDLAKPVVHGGINHLTQGKVSRIEFATEATSMALIKFITPIWE